MAQIITYDETQIVSPDKVDVGPLEDGGSGVSIGMTSGTMSGGASAPAGEYKIILVAQTTFARSLFCLAWTVTP